MDNSTKEQIYAGVLGKIIGVYHGRPVEGWSYERIMKTFGEITYFINDQLDVPVVLPDDDISGTFGFFKALDDNSYNPELSAADIGRAWLNYIIEEKTILWWGGLGRSTEHTAFLHLKSGIDAPKSGSHELNGPWIPAQIGAQIFVDAFAMSAPNNPDLAAHLVRSCASVSHDGLAVDAAVFLGVMESLAFTEKNIDVLIDKGLAYVSDPHLLNVVAALRDECAKTDDWHVVRRWIAENHGYDHYDGPCHMVPNHLVVLMALIMAKDDFSKSITIATSAGWDTDCNAGNVGCLNGIRLGLAAIDSGTDWRTTVSDKMYVVTSDGGSGITDAVQETRRIIKAAECLAGNEPTSDQPRFGFEFSGSTQGFELCPNRNTRQAIVSISNTGSSNNALKLNCFGLSQGLSGEVSTPLFVDGFVAESSFGMEASPTLYSGQTVHGVIDAPSSIKARFYVLYYTHDDEVARIDGDWTRLGDNSDIEWKIPALNGCPCYRLGIEVASNQRFDGDIAVNSIDWNGAPDLFQIEGSLVKSIWNLTPFWTRAWVSSAKHFAPDFKYTFCISHPDDNGIVTTGTRDWVDYSVASELDFSMNESGGLVIRSVGHKRYIAGILKGDEALIIKQFDDVQTVLSRVKIPKQVGSLRRVVLSAVGDKYQLYVDDNIAGTAKDDSYVNGGAGYVINKGTVVANGFHVRKQ